MKTKLLFLALLISSLFISACKQQSSELSEPKEISIIYTNDDYSWMEPTDKTDGAAGLAALWKASKNTDNTLIISGGDMWTGPAISTWFKGISMVEVMNALGYDVAVLGNHDFDFSIDTLAYRIKNQINFPIISANIIEKSTGKIPNFINPYVIKELNGVKVGIIGLTTTSTPYTTFPENVKDYLFTSYADAIDKYAPIVKNEGADVIIIVAHICEKEMAELTKTAAKYNIPLIAGGHCHERVNSHINGLTLIESGSYYENYVKVNLKYYPETGKTIVENSEIIPNTSGNVDTEIEAIVKKWQDKTEAALSQEIGYCSKTINENSAAMANMVCDSWLISFPEADVSITNQGGIRQDIPQGTISLKTIVGLLPFENSIVELELTGSQLIECIDNYLLGGMTTIGGYKLLDGTPIEADKTYKVLTTDYLSSADDEFKKYDDTPYDLSVNYRQPLIDWIKSLNTSSANPLNNHLDHTARR